MGIGRRREKSRLIAWRSERTWSAGRRKDAEEGPPS